MEQLASPLRVPTVWLVPPSRPHIMPSLLPRPQRPRTLLQLVLRSPPLSYFALLVVLRSVRR